MVVPKLLEPTVKTASPRVLVARVENDQSTAVQDVETAKKVWEFSKKAVGLSDKELYKKGKFEKDLTMA
jgi:hypothetical protein